MANYTGDALKIGLNKIQTPLTENQQACVDLLAEALKEAERGLIDTIGIIACMKTGYATVMAGGRASDLNMGCDSLKKKIMDAVENPRRIVKPKSVIES